MRLLELVLQSWEREISSLCICGCPRPSMGKSHDLDFIIALEIIVLKSRKSNFSSFLNWFAKAARHLYMYIKRLFHSLTTITSGYTYSLLSSSSFKLAFEKRRILRWKSYVNKILQNYFESRVSIVTWFYIRKLI